MQAKLVMQATGMMMVHLQTEKFTILKILMKKNQRVSIAMFHSSVNLNNPFEATNVFFFVMEFAHTTSSNVH